jgi:hypothetical protein
MAKREQESVDQNDDLDTTGIPDLDAPAGPPRRVAGQELPENEDLDSEGQPDLIGALHSKEITGDAQEGEIPPREYKQAPDDYWHRDTLDERLAEERPEGIRAADSRAVRLVDDQAETGSDLDAEEAELDDEEYPSAEEAAMHVSREAPGAVDSKVDSYTGDPVEDLDFREEK